MARYVDVEPMVESLTDRFNELSCGLYESSEVAEMLKEQPTADVAPVVHAHWEKYSDIYGDVCSRCGKSSAPDMDYDYCPWCGAKMDEEVSM